MTEITWTWSLHQRIPSSLTIAHQSLEKLLQALRDAGWEGRDYFHVQMASEEALVNAVTHGNKESLDKLVELELHVSPEIVNMRIKDEGAGFCVDDLPDPRCGERLEMVHGRGVLLMKQMMSEVRYVGCGNEVVMSRRRNDPRFDALDDDDDDDVFTED
jgi:serine/threonine-protein kinase RsbW